MKNIKSSIKNQINLIIHLIVKVKNDDVFALASQLAYHLVLSFFPFMIFLITLVGFSNLGSEEVLNALYGILPDSVVELTKATVREVFDNQHTGLLSISIILAIWTSSSGFRAVIKGVNKAYNLKETRSFIKRTIISILGILGLAVIILLALGILVFGKVIGKYLEETLIFYNFVVFIWEAFRYGFIFILMIFIFSVIYRLAPAKKLTWAKVIPGSVFSTIGWVMLSLGFSIYINSFSNFSRFYGSLGTVFILITWLYLISLIFMFGVEINCVISQAKDRRNFNKK